MITEEPNDTERTLYHRITAANCLQESSDGTDNGEHSSASLGSSAGELGWRRLGAGGGTGGDGIGGGSSVLGWVRNNRLGGVDRGNNWGAAGLDGSRAGLDGGRGGLDWDGGGVLAVIVNDGGALGDGVGLGADLEGGGLGADGGETLDGGGGVRWVLGSLGAHWVRRVTDGRAGGVGRVLRGLGGLVGGRGHGGGVVRRVAIGVGVGSGGEASDDGEGAHVDCWGDY